MASSLSQCDITYKDTYEPERPMFDIHCYELGGQGFNAYKSSCVTRLSAPSPQLCCRRCSTGHDIVEEFGLKVKTRFHRCQCGRVTNTDYRFCEICRDKHRVAKQKSDGKKKKVARKCQSRDCDSPSTSQMHRYCDPCRERAEAVVREKEKKRIHKRIEKEQAKLEAL